MVDKEPQCNMPKISKKRVRRLTVDSVTNSESQVRNNVVDEDRNLDLCDTVSLSDQLSSSEELQSSDEENSDKERERSNHHRLLEVEKRKLKMPKILLPVLTPYHLEEILCNAGVFLKNVCDQEDSCFERLYVKQVTHADPTCFIAMRLKKEKHRDQDFYDGSEILMPRSVMNDPVHGLVLYDFSNFVEGSKEWTPEPECEYDEEDLLQQQGNDLETWIGPCHGEWSGKDLQDYRPAPKLAL
jgi:hypothetical protein